MSGWTFTRRSVLRRSTSIELKAEEKARAEQLQREGSWLHLWRIAGHYSNISIFDVPDHDALHVILSTLPLFPFMAISVTPLAQHPSAIRK